MRELRSEIEISATREKVWALLMDFEKWKEWNPIVNFASGSASLNSQLNITMRGKDGKDANKYKPVIAEFEAPKLFRWRAKMMSGFLFTNDKIFELEEISSATRLVHTEAFDGILVSLFWSKLCKAVPQMLNSMNEALKKRAENNG